MTKLEIFAHRGLWTCKSEQNTFEAIRSAFESGYSIETDIRDYLGEIVVAHDPVLNPSTLIRFQKIVELINYYDGAGLKSALNVKSDGLIKHLE